MATANLPPTYFSTFNYVDANGESKPAVGYLLYQYAAGTTTNQDTYTSQAGTTPNSHPITLDANGACNLWLDPTLEYKFVLKTPGGSTVWTRDDVFASPNAANVVSSVNGETGAVTLTAPDIGYTTNSPQSWFSGATVGAALDDIITQVNATPAANVTVADAGSYFTAGTVEAVLQELGASTASTTTTGTSTAFVAAPTNVLASLATGSVRNITFHLDSGAAPTIAVSGLTAKLLKQYVGNAKATATILAGQTSDIVYDGTDWVVTSGQQPTGTIGSASSITFQNGLIIKWGTTGSLADSQGNVITFPVAFPTACYGVIAQAASDNYVGAGVGMSWAAHTPTTTQFQINNDGTASIFFWVAIGK